MMDPPDWDSWLPDSSAGFYCSSRWLRLMWDSEGFEDRLLVARDAHGAPTAILPTGTARAGTTNPLYNLNRVNPEIPSPQTVLGTHSGYANGLIVRDNDGLRHWGKLVDRIRADAPGEWVGIPFLSPETAHRVSSLLSHHMLTQAAGRCEIRVDFDSMDGYLARLSASRRSTVRRDLKAFESGGATVEVSPLLPVMVAELAPLLAKVQHRHASPVELATVTKFLTRCANSELAAESIVFSCRKNGRLIAFSLGFRFRSTLLLRVVGLDYERVTEHKEYFTVLVHAPLRYALDNAITTVDLGTEGFRAKLMRGAEYVPQVTVLLRTPADFTVEQARRADELFVAELTEIIGDLVDVQSVTAMAMGASHVPA
jgi:hypothetical protein